MLAALVTIPMSIGFGMLAFAPLGEAFLPTGIVAGLFGAAFLNLIAVAAGAKGAAVYAPRSLIAFMIGSVALHSFATSDSLIVRQNDTVFIAAAMFATLSAAGLVQLAFGAVRLGRLVRFIPTPVMAGFQNAAALVILYSQLHVALGLPARLELERLAEALDAWKPLNLALFAVTVALIRYGGRVTAKIPAALLGLLAGSALYYLLAALGFSEALGPTVGKIPMGLPDGSTFGAMVALAAHPQFLELVPTMLAAALSLAVVASLDVLICAKIVEGVSGQRVPGNLHLLRSGAANFVVPLLGGLSGAINIAGSTANSRAGGRTSLSLVVQSAVVVAILGLVAPLLALLPLVVITSVLTVTALHLVDKWTVQLARKVLTRQAVNWRAIALDLVVIGAVALIALTGSIVSAVLVGIGVAVLLFVLRMSRSVIRAEHTVDVRHSHRTRSAAEWAILAADGRRILLLELEGPIFFGSAEHLAHRIDVASREGVRYVVLDLRRVNDIDSTGARIIVQSNDRLRERGAMILLGAAGGASQVSSVLRDMGVMAALGSEHVFDDADLALEWAEARVIALARAHPEQPGDEMFVIARGSASVKLELPGEGRARRLITFAAGTVFGEMALLDRETRSASVTADDDLVCYVLTRTAYEAIEREDQATAIRLLGNLGREISGRLRRANRALYQLEC
ncbi:MAG: hypothetical protein A3G81_08305 [Betaproteobacteria bacterium RIFCSPLOWO2_12_FULL_65_14]|nr:MAG: hypothetical protein A3G81_08305 [Betaproteobacteria bacterium RIFCSPLOWO2_12_FULL_65_14]